ncbi:MAG: HD domain-containing protein [Lachnospiraceae bacterium]|nr:HD domain-containing protein [Lachnospiraceae bacterium]
MYKVSISEARVGMVLVEPVMAEDGQHYLLKAGQVLNSAMLKRLRDFNVPLISVADIYSLQIDPIDRMGLVVEKSYRDALDKYSSPQRVGNKRDDIPQIVEKMQQVIERICEDEMIINYCLQMRMVKERDLYQKAIETSVFSGLLAGVCGCTGEELYHIMVGGLLHDAGCLEMTFLIGKQGKTGQEELLWREHPTYGYYFAIQNELPREVAEIIQYHEERIDGSGYPKQLKGDEIPLGARIVAICAGITESTIYNGMKPYEALEIIYGTAGVYFDVKLVNLFLGSVALYPMGALVRLTTGEIGVITNIRKNYGARPVVNVHYNSFYKPLSQPKEIDLGEQRTIFIEEILG